MIGVWRAPTAAGRGSMLAVGAVGLLAGGAAVALAGIAGGGPSQVVVGAVAAGAGLAAMLLLGVVEGPWLVALAVPGPAWVGGDLRIALAAPVAALVVAVWGIQWLASRRRLQTGSLPVRETLLLLAVYGVAGAVSQYPLSAAREVLNLAVLLLLLVAAVDQLGRSPGLGQRVARTMAILAPAVGLAAVFEAAGIVPGRFPAAYAGLFRAALTFGQPNELGLYLALSLPFVVHAWETGERGRSRALWLLGVGCATAGLLATLSRGSWFAVAGGAAALVLTGRPGKALRIWIAALAVLLLADLASGGVVRERLARTLGDWVVEQRLQLTLAGVAMFASRPVLGVGPGGFAEELDRVGANLPALTDYLPTPHNALVQMAAEAGVPGLLAFVLFVGRAWWRVLLQARRSAEAEASAQSLAEAALWSVTAGLLASLFLWPLSHGAGEAFVLALALGLAGVGSPEPAGARGAPP